MTAAHLRPQLGKFKIFRKGTNTTPKRRKNLFYSPPTNENNPNLTPIGDWFGFVIFIDYPNFNSKRKN